MIPAIATPVARRSATRIGCRGAHRAFRAHPGGARPSLFA